MSIENRIKEMREQAEKLEAIKQKFPDLQITKDRWGIEHFQSESINSQITDFHVQYNCGCCPDSLLEARPYIIVEGYTIHGTPYAIRIGEGTYQGYDNWDADWKEYIQQYGFPQAAIDKLDALYQRNLADRRISDEDA